MNKHKNIWPWDNEENNAIYRMLLPKFTDKSVLDIACKTGFLCSWALFNKAKFVCGVDTDQNNIDKAKLYFPKADFYCDNWKNVLDKKFDIIISPFKAYHGKDLKENLQLLMEHLSNNGILILETCLANSDTDDFGIITHNNDNLYYPTWDTFTKIIQPYTHRGVRQCAPTNNMPAISIFHIYPKKPVILLFMDRPYSGKTTICEMLKNDSLPRIHSDTLISRIKSQIIDAPQALKNFLVSLKDSNNFQLLIESICDNGLLSEFLSCFHKESKGESFIFDGYIPENSHKEVEIFFDNHGYFIVKANMLNSILHNHHLGEITDNLAKQYSNYLIKQAILVTKQKIRG